MPNNLGQSGVTKTGNPSQPANRSPVTVLHVRRWVVWWFYVGVVCGAVALANIFLRHFTRTQDEVILFLGVLHWILGGLVCWAWEGVKFEKPAQGQENQKMGQAVLGAEKIASDQLLREAGQPQYRSLVRLRLLNEDLLRWEKRHHVS